MVEQLVKQLGLPEIADRQLSNCPGVNMDC